MPSILVDAKTRSIKKWFALQTFAAANGIDFYSHLIEDDFDHLSFTEVMDLLSDLFTLVCSTAPLYTPDEEEPVKVPPVYLDKENFVLGGE